MWKFGQEWHDTADTEEVEPKGKAFISWKDPDRFRPPLWCKYVSIGLAGLFSLILVVSVMWSAGGDAGERGAGKAVLVLFEGFKGTVFHQAVIGSNRAPNLKTNLRQFKLFASCATPTDTRCAHTQRGQKLGGSFGWYSAPGLLSILTGVDANLHGVANDSLEEMGHFAKTSKKYPTVLQRARNAGLRTAAVGASHLLTTVADSSGTCTSYGILDFECGTETVTRGGCLRSSSCNLDKRIAFSSVLQTADLSSTILENVGELIDDGYDLIVLHFNQLAVTAFSEGEYSADSAPYVAQLYLADAVMGQLLVLLKQRVQETLESWIVLGTSDHGGSGHTFGGTPKEDENVPFFIIPVLPGNEMKFKALKSPYQFDAAPTLLSWLGITSTETTTSQTPTNPSRDYGIVQGICSDGRRPRACTIDEI